MQIHYNGILPKDTLKEVRETIKEGFIDAVEMDGNNFLFVISEIEQMEINYCRNILFKIIKISNGNIIVFFKDHQFAREISRNYISSPKQNPFTITF